MTRKSEYALIAGSAYVSQRNPRNRLPADEGWLELPGGHYYDQSSGFEAAAYRTGDENRIAYRRRYDGGVDRDRNGYSGADAIDAGVCMPFARLTLGDAIGIMAPTRNRPLPRVAA